MLKISIGVIPAFNKIQVDFCSEKNILFPTFILEKISNYNPFIAGKMNRVDVLRLKEYLDDLLEEDSKMEMRKAKE